MAQANSNPERPIPFIHSPERGKMRDPLLANWNLALASDNVVDGSPFNLAELVDFSQINEVFANYLEVVGLPVAIVDFNGLVLASSHWQRLCMEFHRAHTGALARCLESDRSLSRQMDEGKNYPLYRCLNGLTDCASPIIVEGQHIANLFIGQFFLEPPDLEYYEAQCAEFGFDRERYFKALAEVPIVAEDRLPSILKMLVGFATLVANQSIAQRRAKIAFESVEKQVIERTQALVEAKERLEAAASAGIIGIWDWDIPNDVMLWDEVMYKLYGVHQDDFVATYQTWLGLLHPDDKISAEHAVQLAFRGEREYSAEFRVIWPDGSNHHLKAVSKLSYSPEGQPLRMVGVNYDLTEQKKIQAELDFQAFHDRLTGLPNRRRFDHLLDKFMALTVRERRKLALLFIDLDKFKVVNDSAGHDAGDWLLQQVAERLHSEIRASDTVARLGGDEFIAFLPDVVSIGDAVTVAEKLRAALSQPFIMDEARTFHISASIGVAVYPNHADDAQSLMRMADEAMYKAKRRGRNAVVICDRKEGIHAER